MQSSVVLFRHDLRLADHRALHGALETGGHVIPAAIIDPEAEGDWTSGGASNWWRHHSLCALNKALQARGNALVVLRGDTTECVRRIITATGAESVHWHRAYEPGAIARDKALKSALRDDGIHAESHCGAVMAEPWQLATGNGDPYRVFSPFARRFHAQVAIDAPLPTPDTLPMPETAHDLPHGEAAIAALELLPSIPWDSGLCARWTPGEDGANARLEAFFAGAAQHYATGRELPGREGTSRLSPHLHFGEVSPRQAWARAEAAKASQGDAEGGIDHYQRELIWREFAYHLIYHFPDTPDTPLNPRFNAFPWRDADDYASDLARFTKGTTGIPIVDAGMRQLWHEGWMHNRVRMIVGSFLTKNLLIPWQEGARWFWDTLVDADLASNTLGWQWAGGSGADAAPYFRIFNPVRQGERFDPDGAYVRHWVPEIAVLPDALLHAPWEAPDKARAAGVAADDPCLSPLVDLKASRQRALAAYEHVKG